jgi:hypothetical protein
MENNPAISTPEWNGYLSNSYKELYDMLVAAYGNDYYMAMPYQFSLTGAQFYNLPDGSPTYLDTNGNTLPAFYKALGVDLQYSGSPTGWVSLRRFEFIERNKYAYPNTTININGYTNLRYRFAGNQLFLIPIPATSQACRVWYVPEPSPIQLALTGALTVNSTTITVNDASNITAGMSVYASMGITSGTTVISRNLTNNTVVLSSVATATVPITTILFWNDSTTIDGIAGWEEYVIMDAVLKGMASEKVPISDASLISGMLVKMKNRIESMAEGRDIGQAQHTSDAMSLNGFGDCSDDMFGFGGNGWGGY